MLYIPWEIDKIALQLKGKLLCAIKQEAAVWKQIMQSVMSHQVY